MRAIILSVASLFLLGCVEFPDLPHGSAEGVALPFICAVSGVPVVGGWVVVSSEDFDSYSSQLGYWESCNGDELVACEMYPEEAVSLSQINHQEEQAH